MKPSSITKQLIAAIGIFGMVMTLNTSIYAASSESANSPEYDLKVTSCISQFDWAAHIAAVNSGLATASTWNDIGCASDTQVVDNGVIKKTRYNQFTVGNAAKQAFGDLPVLDIFPNQGFAAQNNNTYNDQTGALIESEQVFDRSKASNLNSIFSADELNQLYPTGGSQTGAPRVFSTGKDQFKAGATPRVYEGGWCKVENGQIVVRTSRDGESFRPEDYSRSRDDVDNSCARSGKDRFEDMPFEAYQFVYEIPYWTNQECQDFAGFTADQYDDCLNFFYTKYGSLGGNVTSGDRIYAVYTYYGAFSQPSNGVFNWVGWKNPNIGGPRATSNGFVRSYDGFSVYVK